MKLDDKDLERLRALDVSLTKARLSHSDASLTLERAQNSVQRASQAVLVAGQQKWLALRDAALRAGLEPDPAKFTFDLDAGTIQATEQKGAT
jgi:hypothetical protein